MRRDSQQASISRHVQFQTNCMWVQAQYYTYVHIKATMLTRPLRYDDALAQHNESYSAATSKSTLICTSVHPRCVVKKYTGTMRNSASVTLVDLKLLESCRNSLGKTGIIHDHGGTLVRLARRSLQAQQIATIMVFALLMKTITRWKIGVLLAWNCRNSRSMRISLSRKE